ncbi:hypothetical protein LTR84_012540 [Exophiala bonariae]|uniref:Zn(2)-C6 fungal-type domain-containing protein n=1 Tax=Exophiala bonariae TaxID=1690606 RepID=A0AAV9NEB1_9EURO|nr:hypothetical protein LTR84_012540 [Exophiala bonariae]
MSNHVRLACDRCRASKLRCPRHEVSERNACDRCIRAGTSCITSSARPLGRPRTKQPIRGTSASVARDRVVSSNNTTSFQELSTSINSATYDLGGNVINTSPELPNLPTWLDTGSDSGLNVLNPINGDFINYQEPSLGGIFSPRLYTPYENTNVDPALMPIRSENTSPPRTPQTDAIIKLSHLGASIAMHKAEAEAYPLCIPPGPNQRLCAETSDEIENIPVVRALQIASEFSTILEWLASNLVCSSSSTSATSSPPSEKSYSSSSPSEVASSAQNVAHPYTKPILLLILSNYIQMIELYNYILGRVCEVIGQIRDTSDFFEISTKFRVNGIPPMKPQTYVSFILQATAEDLQSVERLMGLPEELRISQHHISRKGIFSDVKSRSLLRLVLGEADSECGKDSATSAVTFLRETLHTLDTELRRVR